MVRDRRITKTCTGVAVADFSLCLHVYRRHLGDVHRYPTEMMAFHAEMASAPTCDTYGVRRY
ncbi:hypothetical protein [Rubripirellula obstinata]|uniref:hypothetical protein n=1 Tax=Rubripirellula obstinata TaxID=406547 RepID=UPI0013900B86|nr:hypothetical protein [Rubripirellula obstinata]